jgi:hypothetical protein
MKNKTDPVITFSCSKWAVRKYAPILPASNFYPPEWRQIPNNEIKPFEDPEGGELKSIKLCPAVNDYIGAGYVIPAWCDIEISFVDDDVVVKYSDPDYRLQTHLPEQLEPLLKNKFKSRIDIKLSNPWAIHTKPGYSLMWLPMLYHDTNYQAMPGILDTDLILNDNPINIMLKEEKTTLIKLGDPLVQVIPFKRETITAESREFTEADYKRRMSILDLMKLTRYGWRQFVRSKKTYKLDKFDLDLPR